MNQDRQNDTKDEYCFNRLPNNVRQVGETMQGTRFFIEDYVMTFLRKNIEEKREEGLVVFVGKKGIQSARGCVFIYGAIPVECAVSTGADALDSHKWKEIYQTVQEYFPQGEIFGFGCGVGIWNSQIDESIRKIQKEHFCADNRLFFLADLGEKEEKVFSYEKEELRELSGYVVFFDKNTQMQEYMLSRNPSKSFEGEYCDEVTKNIRDVIQKKSENAEYKRVATYGMSVMLFLLSAIGAVLLFQSTQRIRNLQETIETLSNAAGSVATESAIENGAAITVEATETPKVSHSIQDKEKKVVTSKPKKTIKPESKSTKKPVAMITPTITRKPATAQPTKKAVYNAGYRVKAGDTLSQIVWRQYHNMECMALVKKVNRIDDGDKIKEGQYLLLPVYDD